ncbi:MAG: flagellar biosynthesis protein FliQ [Lachnospiraceae bacterium]|nr:flagellar biosynthesis protein FliQ [Lachnospiraceae bacterium]
MQTSDVADITRNALFLVIQVAAPILLISLVIGLIVSIFQTVTSIQEQTLTFVPKIIITFLGIILLGNWMLTQLITYIHTLWDDFSIYIR